MSTQGKIRIYSRTSTKKDNKTPKITYSYSIEVGIDPVTGKRKRKYECGFQTKKEARIAGQKQLNLLLIGKNVLESNITFNEYATRWLEDYKQNVKLATQRNAEQSVLVGKRYFKYKKLKDISTYDYQQFINHYSQTVKKGTLLARHSILSRVFTSAVKYHVIQTNPTVEIDIPNIISPKKKVTDLYLNKEELKQFLELAKFKRRGSYSDYFYVACCILAYTGMRVGELCALTWEDVNLEKKTIYIHSSMFARSYHDYVKQDTPKNEASIRTIIIGNTLVSLLKEWKRIQLELRIKMGTQNKRDKENYVLTKFTKDGSYETAVITRSIEGIFSYLNRKKKFHKHLHAHMLRHTHVSLLAETKVPLYAIQERLGHTDDAITRHVYLHVTEKTKYKTAQVFDEYMAR